MYFQLKSQLKWECTEIFFFCFKIIMPDHVFTIFLWGWDWDSKSGGGGQTRRPGATCQAGNTKWGKALFPAKGPTTLQRPQHLSPQNGSRRLGKPGFSNIPNGYREGRPNSSCIWRCMWAYLCLRSGRQSGVLSTKLCIGVEAEVWLIVRIVIEFYINWHN